MKRGRPKKPPEYRKWCCSITLTPEAWGKLDVLKRDLAARSRGAAIEWLIERYYHRLDLEDEQ